MTNTNQKPIKNKFITSTNNHLNYHQREVYKPKNNNNFKREKPEQTSNSFYMTHYKFNSINPTIINNNSNNLNTTMQSSNKHKNQNIINFSNFKKKTNQKAFNKNKNINNNNNNNVKNIKQQVQVKSNTQKNFYNNLANKSKKDFKLNDENMKNYIIYLKNNLNSSYYANNDLNNEYNKLINKSKEINDTINNKNDKYINMNKIYEENLEKNKNFQQEYKNLVNEYKLNHLNDQNKLKDMIQMMDLQDHDIQKLENENNILNDDILNKKIIYENLKKKVEKLKNRKNLIDVNDEYLYLFKKKNNLIFLNEKTKKIKSKNDELIKTINNIRYDLEQKDKIILEHKNIYNKLFNKYNELNQKEKDYKNENSNEININIKYGENENKDIKNNMFNINDLNIGNIIIKDKEFIDNYKRLFEKENKRKELINEKMNLYKDEINKLKKEIISLKSKNSEEISSYKDYINNFPQNEEEIKKILISKKNNILNQRESLIKYNKKYSESLSEKMDLENKIRQLKNENKNLQLRLNERPKSIDFKIKAIKIRKNNKEKLERNMSESDLIKNNSNNKLYISQNRENFIPIKEIYRYKKYEYKYRNGKRLLNNINIRRNSSFDSIFKYNDMNKIEKESNIDLLSTPRSGIYLYAIDKEGKLLGYEINLKKYVYINTSSINGWNFFYKEYKNNSNGSLLLNTLAGLFVLTGKNYNHLYYYSQSKNIINLIMILKSNHKYGGLILTNDNTKIIILGGIYSNEVELFDIEKNNLEYLPNLLTKRINSSYNIINGQFLVAFFGKNNNTIEYLDLNDCENWEILDYRSNNQIIELSGHIGFHANKNIVVIVGGINNDKIIVFYFKEKFVDVTDFILTFDSDCGIDELIFDKEKFFNIIENKEKISENGKYAKENIGMDIFGNVHCFDNNYSYTIYVF